MTKIYIMKELNNFRKFIQENELHEGTWSLGSAQSMEAAISQLQGMMREDDPAAWMQAFEDLDGILYRVFGDDGFHDALGDSKAAVEAGDIDRAKNALGDALGVAQQLLAYQVKQNAENLEENDIALDEILDEGFLDRLKAKAKGAVAGAKATVANIKGDKEGGIKDAAQAAKLKSVISDLDKDIQDALKTVNKVVDIKSVKSAEVGEPAQRFFRGAMQLSQLAKKMMDALSKVNENDDVSENDAVLDEVSNSMGIFKDIDAMIGSIKDQMDPDDAFDSLVSEFEAISGGTKLLHQALKNISLDNNLSPEEKANVFVREEKDEE